MIRSLAGHNGRGRRAAPLAVLAAMVMALGGCLLTPGKFVSALDIRADGRFTFTYVGEIHMLALSKLAEMGDANRSTPTFSPSLCFRTSGEERPCTAAELAGQKTAWAEQQRRSAERKSQNSEPMKAMLGGIDPADPRAAEEFAQRLRRQTGWKRLDYRGDGLFNVDFALSGRLDHDFTFPTIERFPTTSPFVQIAVRQDGTVRIDAPGYGPAQGGEPFRSLMQAGAMSGSMGDGSSTITTGSDGGLTEVGKPPAGKPPANQSATSKPGMPALPVIDGRFTIRTDGAILANNTDEGPQVDPAGQRLDWTITMRSTAAPTALVRLKP